MIYTYELSNNNVLAYLNIPCILHFICMLAGTVLITVKTGGKGYRYSVTKQFKKIHHFYHTRSNFVHPKIISYCYFTTRPKCITIPIEVSLSLIQTTILQEAKQGTSPKSKLVILKRNYVLYFSARFAWLIISL